MKNSLKAVGVGAALAASLTLAGCGSSANSSSSASADSSAAGSVSGEVKVFAAASLRNAGKDLEAAFKKAHPNVNFSFTYEGSSKLVQKIEQGEDADEHRHGGQCPQAHPTDVAHPAPVVGDEFKGSKSEVIATNKLVLVTADGNPGKINSIDDLKNTDGTVAICKEDVPCGTLAHKELKDHNIELKNATNESNVAAVTTKVTSGSADAGFIYTTDLAAAKKDGKNLGSVDLPDVEKNEYPSALTSKGNSSEAAKKFNEWLTTDEAQKILKEHGFESAR